jgi:hypothetical protein
MTSQNIQIETIKNRIMRDALELAILSAQDENLDGIMRTAHFMLAGTMATLHPLLGQRMAYEAVLAMLDSMGTMDLGKDSDGSTIQ